MREVINRHGKVCKDINFRSTVLKRGTDVLVLYKELGTYTVTEISTGKIFQRVNPLDVIVDIF